MADADATALTEAARRGPVRLVARLVHPHRLRFRLAVISSGLNKLFDLAPPLLVAWAVLVVQGRDPMAFERMFGAESIEARLWLIAGAVVVIFGLESLFQWAFKVGFGTLAQRVQHDLRTAAYRHLQGLHFAWFEDHRTGEIMSVLNNDVNQLERFFETALNDLLQVGFLFVIAGGILFAMDPGLALLCTLPVPGVVLHSIWFQRRIAPRYAEVRERVGGLNARLENNLGGVAVVKSFTTEDHEQARVDEESARYRDASESAVRLAAIFTPSVRMWIAVSFAVCLGWGGWRVVDGTLELAVLTGFAMMVQRLLWPLTRIGAVLNEYERARAAAGRVARLMAAEAEVRDPAEPAALPEPVRDADGTPSREVHFDHVTFEYARAGAVLRGTEFTAAPGETVGIAGPTGAGKTTLVKLLLRFHDVGGGAVRLDGVDIRDLPVRDLRREIALVTQDVYLFHGSVRENIAYGSGGADDAVVEEAARTAHVWDFIAGLPDGLDTIVGERGIKLSGGQRQRISLARAIVKNAPVLVLDEATSSVDTETERVIQDNLARITAGRTALVIAHRLSTIRHADRILVLQDGVVREEGRHEELVAADGVYADLWALQAGV